MSKEPLYPHIPKKKEPLFPHGTKAGKEPWQMTLEEYAYVSAEKYGHGKPRIEWLKAGYGEAYRSHKTAVERALREGKPVPAEVLAGYPYLRERMAKDKISRDSFGKDYGELSAERQLGVDLAYLRDQEKLNLDLLASTEGDPIRKFCCRLCGECAPKELLEEGRFLDRISWLRSHYQAKHPGMWGKMSPMTVEDGEPVSPQYRHLTSLVSEPLPEDAY